MSATFSVTAGDLHLTFEAEDWQVAAKATRDDPGGGGEVYLSQVVVANDGVRDDFEIPLAAAVELYAKERGITTGAAERALEDLGYEAALQHAIDDYEDCDGNMWRPE